MGDVAIKQAGTMGRGVFAARPISAGTHLADFYTIKLPPDEVVAMRGCTLSHFWFEDDTEGSALIVLGWLELVNHSATPNCDRSWRATPVGEVVSLFTLVDIAKGSQLFIDYRFDEGRERPPWA